MWEWLKPVVGTLGKIVGGVSDFMGKVGPAAAEGAAAYLGYKGQQETNAANAAQAQKQMDFQERMRATQYQTTVADLNAAGLNPALAYSQGGAGTPGGSAATMGNPMTSGINSAGAAANIANTIAQARLTSAQAENTGVRTERERVGLNIDEKTRDYRIAREIAIAEQEKRNNKWSEQTLEPRIKQIMAQLRMTTASARESELRGDIAGPEAAIAKSKYGKFRPYIKDVLSAGSSAASIVSKF